MSPYTASGVRITTNAQRRHSTKKNATYAQGKWLHDLDVLWPVVICAILLVEPVDVVRPSAAGEEHGTVLLSKAAALWRRVRVLAFLFL